MRDGAHRNDLKHAYATTWNVAPRHMLHWQSKIHFPISNIDARKKLKIWACVEFQGTSVDGLRFYSMSIFDNEKLDALPYSCDFSSRGVCVVDNSAQNSIVRFL